MPPALLNSIRPSSIDFHRGEAGLRELKVARRGRSARYFSRSAVKEFGGEPNYRLQRENVTPRLVCSHGRENMRAEPGKRSNRRGAEVIRVLGHNGGIIL